MDRRGVLLGAVARDLAASTVKRKRRDLDTRIADIVCTATECEQTRLANANARDQLMSLTAPDLVEPQ